MITILALGLRGDIQPLIALGARLRAAGADVRCAAPEDFAATARRHGLEVVSVEGRAADFFGGAAGIALRERLRNAREFQRLFDDHLPRVHEKLLNEAWAAASGADAVVCGPWAGLGPLLAEGLGVPVFIASTFPVMHLPTSAFPNPFVGPLVAGPEPAVNRRTWRLSLPAMRAGERTTARFRETAALAPSGWRCDLGRLRRLPHLLAYSQAVLPRPADWPPWVHVTGYWFLDEVDNYEPPRELERFLAEGPPPVAIGFSSQVGRDTAGLTRLVMSAVERAGVRAVLVSGFGGLKGERPPASVHVVGSAPYEWLFGRVRAVVHHGGSGSTGMALRFGLPNVAVPFGYDQGLWGQRLHALGAGPAPIDAAALTIDGLAAALRRVTTDDAMRRRAQAIGARIRREDGVGAAADHVLARVRSAASLSGS